MTRLPTPRAILFDWDNTLVDTWPTIHQALNATLRYMNHPEWSLEKVRGNVKKSMRDSFPELFGDAWEKAAQHYQLGYRAIHLQSLQPLPDAAFMLASLPTTIFLGVVSNKRGEPLRLEVEHLGWRDYFGSVVGADDAAHDKPHADPGLLALKDSGIALGEQVWFLGDTIIDLECAANLGATPILYGDHITHEGVYDGHRFAAHVRNHRAFADLVLSACATPVTA